MKSDNSLFQSNDFHRQILDHISGGIQVAQILTDHRGVSVDFRFLDCNAVFADSIGRSREEIIGKKVTDFFPDVEPEWFLKYGEIAQSGKSDTFEMYNGSTKSWYSVLAIPLGGNKLAIVSTDVTRRKVLEQQLHEGDELMHLILGSSQDGIRMLDLRSGRYLLFNPAQAKMTGYTQEELHRMSQEELLEAVHPEDRFLFEEQKKALSSRETHFHIKYRWKVKTGDYRWFSDRKTILRDEKGEAIYLLTICRDITQDRLAQEELKAVSRDLADECDALKSLHDISFRLITETNHNEVYQAILGTAIRLTGADCGHIKMVEPEGDRLQIIAHAGYSPAFLQSCERHSNHKTVCRQVMEEKVRFIEEDITRSPHFSGENGLLFQQEGFVSVQSTPLLSSTGHLLGILSTQYKQAHHFSQRELRMLDLLSRQVADMMEHWKVHTALVESEQKAKALVEELKEEDRNKDHFISVLSHELRNPLAVIQMSLDLQKLELDEDAAFQKTFGMIQRQTHHLTRLIDDLLDVTRINQNRIQLKNGAAGVGSADPERPEGLSGAV